jgi:hypothetical protein
MDEKADNLTPLPTTDMTATIAAVIYVELIELPRSFSLPPPRISLID